MKFNRIFLISLFLVALIAIGFASASEDNLTTDDNSTLQSVCDDAVSVDLNVQEDEVSADDDNGTYLDPTEAYECLNEFRGEDAVWFWAPNNVGVVYFNTHDYNHLKPLIIDPELEKVAKIRAKEISIFYDHERPDGTMCFEIYPDYFAKGENIAIASTGKDATEAWKEEFDPYDDQGHRRNMLSDDFLYVGIAGYRAIDGATYWVQSFAGSYVSPAYVDDKTQRNESKATLADLNNTIIGSDRIMLDMDYEYFNDSALYEGIVIDRSLSIDGNGHSIDGKRFARIFNIDAENVIIKNLKFLNAYFDYVNGGAINANNVNLTLINCSFSNSFAYYGSAISAANSTVSLINCSFNGNLAVEGTLYAIDSEVVLINCSFSDNSAILYGAGACLSNTNVSLDRCIFEDNDANRKGGAIYAINSHITNNNSGFFKNSACLEGGAICLKDSNITNYRVNFENNTLNSTYYAFGAGIYANQSSVKSLECTFSDNHMDSYYRSSDGGAMFLFDSCLSVFDCNFTDNFAMYCGGALCLINNNATVSKSNFNRNSVDNGTYITNGGAIYCESGNLTIEDCGFSQNFAHNGATIFLNAIDFSIKNSDFSNNIAGYNGGAIYSTDGNASVLKCSFANNSARFSGGAISFSGGNVSCDDSIFTNNSGTYGGALRLDNSHISVKNNRFENNKVNYEYATFGGAIYLSNCQGPVSACSFKGNDGYSRDYVSRGAAVYLEDTNTSLTDCEFSKNHAYYGVVYSQKGNVSVTNCNFSKDSVDDNGIIYLNDACSQISDCNFANIISNGSILYLPYGISSIVNSSFINISTRYDGGAICSYVSEISIDRSTFLNVTGDSGYYKNGGAIFLNSCGLNISNSNFTNGFATAYGGAIYLSNCHGSVEQCLFKGNTVNATNFYSYGGALYSINGNMTISKCIFVNNSIYGRDYAQGGALTLKEDHSKVTDCIFQKNLVNSSYSFGGALYCQGGEVLLINSRFNENTANIAGALAVRLENITISDSIFENNTADYEAGSAYFDISNVTVKSSDFANNSARYGGAVCSYEANLSVEDSAFTNNSALSGGAIFVSTGNATVVSSNFSMNSAKNFGGALCWCDAVDSKFSDNIAETAAAIYGEDNTAVNCDFIGNVAYNDNPVSGVKLSGCRLTDNLEIRRVIIQTYTEEEYYPGDKLYVRVSTQDYPYEAVTNATVTIKVFRDNAFVGSFEFSSADYGWNVSVPEGTYMAQLYIDDITFEADSVNVTFTVAHKDIAVVNVTVSNDTYQNPTNVDMISNVDADVEVYLDGYYYDHFEIKANIHSMPTYYGISAGKHLLHVVLTPNNSRIDPISEDIGFEVLKRQTSIVLEAEDVSDNENVIVYVEASENGNVHVTIADLSQDIYIYANEKTAIYFNSLKTGTYEVRAIFSAGENYLDSNASKAVHISKHISQDEIAISNDGSDEISLTLPEDAEGSVTLTIDGERYTVEKKAGTSTVTLPVSIAGHQPYTLTYSGDGKYSGFEIEGRLSSGENPKINPDITIPPLGENTNILLPGDAGGNVTLTINGKDYVYPVSGGVSAVEIPKLANGAYTYTVTYSGDEKYSSFAQGGQISIERPVVIDAKDIKVTYTAGSYYVITVKNDWGVAFKKVSVTVKKNGKAYKTLTTDSKGVCRFKIDQTPGTYKLAITSQAKTVTKTLTVKHLISLKKVTAKKSAKKLVLTATLAKVNGKYLKNKKVTFKFNGKKYTAKTDKKGVAKVTVKKAVLKKLKIGKKITYQATYLKDTVKYTVKVKK